MRASELRLGNYVYDNLGGLLKIKGISTESDLRHIKPIPLTEEILLKCGFVKDEEYDEGGLIDFRYELNLLNKSISFTSNWNTEDCFYVNLTQCGVDVFYLHQLQNLYFALTGEELTINL